MPGKMITITATINAPLETAWNSYTQPEHITQWNFADPSWHCPRASNDLRVGGQFSSHMAARDGSMAFDFGGTYTDVITHQHIAYKMDDDRTAQISFKALGSNQTEITTVFEMESQNPEEMQRGGWQAILNEYKRHTESL
jgi:uncharacterized protein YndB with AHSA1/START domain